MGTEQQMNSKVFTHAIRCRITTRINSQTQQVEPRHIHTYMDNKMAPTSGKKNAQIRFLLRKQQEKIFIVTNPTIDNAILTSADYHQLEYVLMLSLNPQSLKKKTGSNERY